MKRLQTWLSLLLCLVMLLGVLPAGCLTGSAAAQSEDLPIAETTGETAGRTPDAREETETPDEPASEEPAMSRTEEDASEEPTEEEASEEPAGSRTEEEVSEEPADAIGDPGTRGTQGDLPAYYSSRDLGYLTPARGQGKYRSCTYHAVLASIEAYMIKHGVVDGATGKPATTELNLSEVHLAYFTNQPAYDKLGLLAGDSSEKTWVDYASEDPDKYFTSAERPSCTMMTLMRGEGVASESTNALKYSEVDHVQHNGLSSRYAYDYRTALVTDVEWIPLSDMDGVKAAIMEHGAGNTGMYNNKDMFLNTETNAYCQTAAPDSEEFRPDNHGVALVGWDDNFPRESFRAESRPAHDGAWLVKNSAGAGFGDNGYFWLSYEDTSLLNYGKCFFYKVASNSYCDNIYQYDGTGNCVSEHPVPNDSSVANVFTAQGDEDLKAVSICVYDAAVEYDLHVYTNLSNPDGPTTGTMVLEQSGSFANAGYHSVQLDKNVRLRAGQTFSVVFRLRSGNGATGVRVALDASLEAASRIWHHEARPHTSYYQSTETSAWNMCSEEINYRIKAYTREINTSTGSTETDNQLRRYERVQPGEALTEGYYLILGRRNGDDFGLLTREPANADGTKNYETYSATRPVLIDYYGDAVLWYLKPSGNGFTLQTSDRNDAEYLEVLDGSSIRIQKHDADYQNVWTVERDNMYFGFSMDSGDETCYLAPDVPNDPPYPETTYTGRWHGSPKKIQCWRRTTNLLLYKVVSRTIVTQTNAGTVTAGIGTEGNCCGIPGEEVTVTVRYDTATSTSNYKVTLNITNTDTGETIYLTSAVKNTYDYCFTFTMPDGDVRISADVQKSPLRYYFLSRGSGYGIVGGSMSVSSTWSGVGTMPFGRTCVSMRIPEGATVKVQFRLDGAYSLLWMMKNNGVLTSISEADGLYEYVFTMPSENVTLTPKTVEGHFIGATVTGNYGTVSWDGTTLSISSTTYSDPFDAYVPAGKTVTVNFDQVSTKALQKLTVTKESGGSVAVTEVQSGKQYTFVMPNEPVKVKAVFTTARGITNEGCNKYGTLLVQVPYGGLLEGNGTIKAAQGVTVKVTIKLPKEGRLKLLNVTDAYGSNVRICSAGNNSFLFTMPNRNVFITAVFVYGGKTGGKSLPTSRDAF